MIDACLCALVLTAAPSGPDPLEEVLVWHTTVVETAQQVEDEAAAEAAEAAAEAAARIADAQAPDRSVRSPISPVPVSGSLPALLLTIKSNESGGSYESYNPDGCEGHGCYGAYQLHGLYMDDWAKRYGYPEVAETPANQWPSSTQDDVALGLFYSTNPDGAHWCNWVTYC